MIPCFTVSNHLKAAANHIAVCTGIVFLSFLVILGFGPLPRTQRAQNPIRSRSVVSTPKKIRPKMVPNYGKLPPSFEANRGQTNATVRFLARGRGYTIFLTGDEAVLSFKKSSAASVASIGARLDIVGRPSKMRVAQHAPFGALPFREHLPLLMRIVGLGNELEQPWEGRPAPGQPSSSRRAESDGTSAVLRMGLAGANPSATVTGADELPGKSNYIIGNDPKKWRTNVANYAKVRYAHVYSGIDLVYYGNQAGQLEYDFVVKPGADPNQIKLNFAGAHEMRVDRRSGDLVLKVDDNEVRIRKPMVYQPTVPAVTDRSFESASELSRVGVSPDRARCTESTGAGRLNGSFIVANSNQVGFRVVGYDPKRTLVIDPVLSYSTYLGGSGGDLANGVAVDSSGNVYLTGQTTSTDFPTANPMQASCDACSAIDSDAFVAKLNAAGSALVYSTYLGGSGHDEGDAIAVDASGNAYVTGGTLSTDFPTVNAFQSACVGCEGKVNGFMVSGSAFVAKLNAAGSALIYSTYLGGSLGARGHAIAVDPFGSAYVTGNTFSPDFPTVNPLQSTCPGCKNIVNVGDGFVTKLSVGGSALVYSTYLGGSGIPLYDYGDSGYGIAVDSSGDAYVTGYTASTDFPSFHSLQGYVLGGLGTGFVSELNPAGSAFVYSTFLGGTVRDSGNAIAVDSSGNAYVAGGTSSRDFLTVNPLQPTCPACIVEESGGGSNAFVAKIKAGGSALVYSTYLGGSGTVCGVGGDIATGIAVDTSGNAYITGGAQSSDFPMRNPIQALCASCQTSCGPLGAPTWESGFVAKLNSSGSALVYSTYLGGNIYDAGAGIGVDSSGNAFVTGYTASTDFPTMNPLQATDHDDSNVFVAKITPATVSLNPASLTFGAQNPGVPGAPQAVNLSIAGEGSLLISSITASGDFAQANDCASSLANSGCTINVTFTPTLSGLRSGSLTIEDNGGVPAQTVNLSGTGTGPSVDLTPASLTFPGQVSGTSSTPAVVTLTNSGTATLALSGIKANGDFSQTNSCGASVSVGGSCTISVAFTPTGGGAKSGTLIVTSNAIGSPEILALAGMGQDFSLSAASGSSTSATVKPGSTATYTLSLAAQGGFPQGEIFTCSGAPSESTCLVSPNATIAGSIATNVTVTVTTTAPSFNAPSLHRFPPGPLQPRGLPRLFMLLAAMAWVLARRNHFGVHRWKFAVVLLAAGSLLALGLAGCGGGGGASGPSSPTNPGTPAGSYTLTVTGTAGSGPSALSHSITLTMTVS